MRNFETAVYKIKAKNYIAWGRRKRSVRISPLPKQRLRPSVYGT